VTCTVILYLVNMLPLTGPLTFMVLLRHKTQEHFLILSVLNSISPDFNVWSIKCESFTSWPASLLLDFIFSCLLSTMQQHQDLKINPKIYHFTRRFGLLGHHQVCWNFKDTLCRLCYRNWCFHIYYVFKWIQFSCSFYATYIDSFGISVV
jgi:hypothetical protein